MRRRLLRNGGRILAGLGLVALGLSAAGCGSAAGPPAIPVQSSTSLLDLISQAEKRSLVERVNLDDYVRVVSVTLPGGQSGRALYQHPPTRLIYHLRLERPLVLKTAVALLPQAWNQEGDGVVFYVAVEEGSAELDYLFFRHIGPELMEDLQDWQEVSVDLGRYTGKEIRLVLGTDPGPNQDWKNDFAVWREPKLE